MKALSAICCALLLLFSQACVKRLAVQSSQDASSVSSDLKNTPTFSIPAFRLSEAHIQRAKDDCRLLRDLTVHGLAVLVFALGSCPLAALADTAPIAVEDGFFVPIAAEAQDQILPGVKRGFIDLTGPEGVPDDIVDMIQVVAPIRSWFSNDHLKVRIFPGRRISYMGRNVVQFTRASDSEVPLGMLSGVDWNDKAHSQPKFDAAVLTTGSQGALVISWVLEKYQGVLSVPHMFLSHAFALYQGNGEWVPGEVSIGGFKYPGIFNSFDLLNKYLQGDAKAILTDLVLKSNDSDLHLNIDDHIYQDFQDMDGDGLDDYVIVMRPYHSVGAVRHRDGVVVYFRNITEPGSLDIQLSDQPVQAVVKNLFRVLGVRSVDLEEFSIELGKRPGGAKGDLVLRFKNKLTQKTTLIFAINTGKGGELSFELSKKQSVPTPNCVGPHLLNPREIGALKDDTFQADLGTPSADVVTFCEGKLSEEQQEVLHLDRDRAWGYMLNPVVPTIPDN